MVPDAPTVISDRYTVEAEIGRGGAGIVYRARDKQGDRPVAIKVLRAEIASTVLTKRFTQEIALLQGMDHPGLLPILDSGEWNSLPFYVSPLLSGDTLRARITRERQLPLEDVVAIARQIAEALQYAHDRGIIHRDVKPENLLLEEGRICVADFGIAFALERAGNDRLTSSQLALGTPAYMSPEQAAADSDLDGRSDQYGLACVVYELLAGVTPYMGATKESVIGQRFTHRPMPLRAHRPNLPAHIEAAVARALSLAPADRFRTINEFAAAIGEPPRPVPRWLRYRAAALAIIVGALASVGLTQRDAINRWMGEAQPTDLQRIAVVPFDTRGSAPGLPDFVADLTDRLVLNLDGVQALTVTALRASSASRDLKSGIVIRGTVERATTGYRATMQLADAATGALVHSEEVTTPDTSARTAQRTLAASIARSVRRWIGQQIRAAELARGSRNATARNLMLEAHRSRDDAVAIAERPAREDLPAAFASFRRADSLVALARAADARWLEPVLAGGWNAFALAQIQSDTAKVASLRRGLAFAETALAMDAFSARALELRGTIRTGVLRELDLRTDTAFVHGTESDLRRAVALDSTRARAWRALAQLLSLRGAFAEAELAGRRALAQDAFLEDARGTIQRAFYSATMVPDLKTAAELCAYGRETLPNEWLFHQCELVLLRRDQSKRPDPDSAWKLVATMDRLDPPDKARASGGAYFAIFRRMVAATVSARAGDTDRARAELARAHAAVAGSPGLQTDLLYDESVLRHALGERDEAVRLAHRLICARPLQTYLIVRDPLFAWLPDSAKRCP